MWKLCAFEYLQIDCNGGSHIAGLVMSHSLIKYAMAAFVFPIQHGNDVIVRTLMQLQHEYTDSLM